MAVSLEAYAIEAELAGVGGGWTDLSDDVRIADGVQWGYGIRGSGPQDRVASTGSLTFALDNSESNSASLVGYYSPDHANARSGFDVGIRVRVRLTYASTTYTRFIGRVGSIVPEPGSKLDRKTIVIAYDWIDEAARFKLSGIPTQLSQRADELIQTIVNAITVQPTGVSLATGIDTYEYALDSARDESSYALAEFSKIAQSEVGYVFLSGDGTLVFHSRHTRPAISTNAFVFDNAMSDLTTVRSRDLIYNRVQVTAHPRRVDDSVVTLYTLQHPARVLAGESVVIFGGYVDPTQQAARVGGFDMVAPVATTDYTMNEQEHGGGADLTGSFTVSSSFGGNGHYTTFTNNAAVTGYITSFRVRGKGIYDYENAIVVAEDASSKTTYGENVLSIDMPYQNDPSVAIGLAGYLVNSYAAPKTYVTTMRFLANLNTNHMAAAVAINPGTRIGVAEAVTGVVASSGGYDIGYFVQSVDCELSGAGLLTVSVTVTPADAQAFWVLGTSALSVDTGLGYI